MSAETQLERSVLESKASDELHAIVDAMGIKVPARTKKADLVDKILTATGVQPASGNGEAAVAEKPKRAPRRTTNGSAEANGADTAVADPVEAAPAKPGNAGGPSSDADAGAQSSESSPAESSDPGRGSRSSGGQSNQGQSNQGQSNQGGQGGQGSQGGPGNQGQGQGVQGQGGQGNQGGQGQGGQGNQNRQRFDAQGDAGNKRNRRRRGRDRDRPGQGQGQGQAGDLQGQGQEAQYTGDPIDVSGLLDLRDEGFGFLRTSGYLGSAKDIYVSISQVRRFALRKGDQVEGAFRPAASNEKYPALLQVNTVNGMTPDEARERPRFEDLTPLFPDSKLKLEEENDPLNMTARIIDLISPIGKGQRGLIVSPPKAGKTTIMKQIAKSIELNNPEVHLMVLLVDERPEEVTDMKRFVKGEVVGSTFDRPADEHTAVAELAIERAKRLVEMGKDVVVILDGITRLARAYNLAAPASGRILSGGIDTGALYPPKKFFGSARNLEEGGSLTILATALVETGSKMDEVIFEEFKGTGNMELRLDRRLAERRVYPAIDVNASSTRHEELLFDRKQLELVWRLRRVLNGLAEDGSGAKAIELLFDKIKATRTNDEFLDDIAKAAQPPV